jgi:hypothetical protein
VTCLADELGAGLLLHHPRGDRRAVENTISVLSTARLSVGLWEGFTGLAWALAHLGALADEDFAAIDATLLELVRAGPWRGHHDLIGGLAGLGVYALERRHRDLLGAVVDQLELSSRTDDDGRFWWTAPALLPDHQREVHPGGHVDLGVAHGVPGVAWLLAAAGPSSPQAHRMLPEVVGWLRRREPAVGHGFLPSWTTLDGMPEPSARVAWCYGDLGVAVVLAQCAQRADRPDWGSWATELGIRAAATPVEHSGVVDAGLCHGAAGVAHLFARLHALTGAPELAEAADTWWSRLAGLDVPRHGGLLTGTGGVELARRAAVDITTARWDRAMLASMPEWPA